jgi:cytochrome P450
MSLPAKSLLDPEVVQCPYPYYEELRRERPIAFLPELNAYFASSYEMVKLILRDKRFLKGAPENDGRKFVVPSKVAQQILLADSEIGLPIHCISQSNGEEHAQFRKLVEPFLGRKAAMTREPAIQSCVDVVFAEIEKSDTCEIVADFSAPYTLYVMSDVIGLPRSMYNEAKAYAAAALTYLVYVVSEEEAVAGAKTMVAMHGVVRELIRERRKNPQDDLLSALAVATVNGQPLTERQMCYIVEELVVGGHETTANAINSGLTHLAQHPELQATLRAHPEQLPSFVEEVLRALPPIQAAHRIATEDIELGGVVISKGCKVFLGTASANRDESKFACPASFDHNRTELAQHVAFGGGLHFCAGAYLSRAEQRIAYNEWLKRFSSFELAQPAESIKFHASFATRSPVEVQVRMKRARS